MTDPKVTIGIPTYNGERFIVEAVDSMLAQSYADFELIVVDDQSSDSTVEVVRSIRDPRITVYENTQRLGIPGNWNRALALARGEYICVFHQDDCMRPDNLERKVDVLDVDSTIGLVHSAIEMLIEPSALYSPTPWVEHSAEDFVVDGLAYFRRLMLEGNLICAPTVLARRENLLKAGGFAPQLGFACDYALWMTLCLDSRVAFLSTPLVQYRWHADNETHRYRFEKGVQEAWMASQGVLSAYGRRPGREQEAELLRAAVDALAKARQWAAQLETAKAWLEEQVRNWQQEAEQRGQTITELQDWVAQLETAKAWLEEQVRNGQQEAEQREEVVLEQRRTLESLRHRIATLEQEQARVGQTLGELERRA